MNSEQITRPIVLACDAAYAMPLATTLRSIVEANRNNWPLDFHVLSEGFSDDTKRRVFDSLPGGAASIRWLPVDLSPFGDFATLSHISKMTYSRFLIPSIFPDTVSKVLYLDADLLVLDDLNALWETDLEGAVLGAVKDALDTYVKSNEEAFAEVPRLKEIPRVRNYFNAGVLLIDLDRWREEQISEKSLKYLAQHPTLPFADQDALNVICDGLWKQVKARWNFQDHYEKRISDMNPDVRPGIVHFVTRFKPWKPSSASVNALFYDAFRNRTLFARTPQEKLWEVFEGIWCRFRSILWRSAFYQLIKSRLKFVLYKVAVKSM
ncbi:MAG TPA: glycosyltransferase family 8 protein [Methylobacter sp.]|jgi:lipopolysaccharide biosynthesis glycosyltransferase